MASVGSSLLPASALLTTPKVVNFDLALANTEYAITLPIGTKKFTLQSRYFSLLKVADTSGDIVNDLYFTISPGVSYNADSVTGSSIITLYVSSSKPSQTLEVFYWT